MTKPTFFTFNEILFYFTQTFFPLRIYKPFVGSDFSCLPLRSYIISSVDRMAGAVMSVVKGQRSDWHPSIMPSYANWLKMQRFLRSTIVPLGYPRKLVSQTKGIIVNILVFALRYVSPQRTELAKHHRVTLRRVLVLHLSHLALNKRLIAPSRVVI